VVGAAKPGEVLISEATRTQVGGASGFQLRDRGTKRFKHVVEPMPVYRAVPEPGEAKELEIDPVCRMAVDPARAASAKRRRGFTYFFCSDECREAFDEKPLRYIATTPAGRVAR
jgi:adenylate cyclase